MKSRLTPILTVPSPRTFPAPAPSAGCLTSAAAAARAPRPEPKSGEGERAGGRAAEPDGAATAAFSFS